MLGSDNKLTNGDVALYIFRHNIREVVITSVLDEDPPCLVVGDTAYVMNHKIS